MFFKPADALPISMSLRGNSDLTGTGEGRLYGAKGRWASHCMCNVPVISLFGPCYAPVISAALSCG